VLALSLRAAVYLYAFSHGAADGYVEGRAALNPPYRKVSVVVNANYARSLSGELRIISRCTRMTSLGNDTLMSGEASTTQGRQCLRREAVDLFLSFRIMRNHELQTNVGDAHFVEHLQSLGDLFDAAL
jgi:hypothetical protein